LLTTITVTITMAPTLEPFPTETEDFAADDRISFSKTAGTHLLEAEDGTEWEWLARVSKWIPVVRNKSSPAPRNLRQQPGRLW